MTRTYDCEVSHADLLGETFLDQRHAGKPFPVTGEFLLNRLQEDPWGNFSKKNGLKATLCSLHVLGAKIAIRNLSSRTGMMDKLTIS